MFAPLQDVPSFLQEVTTPRGQVTYATPALRAAHRVPADLDTSDDVAMAQQELLVPLATMAAASPATRSGDKGDSGCAHPPFPPSLPDVLPPLVAVRSRFVAPLAARRSGPGGGALVPRGARYTHSSPAQLRLVLARQATLFKRDPTLSRARVAQCVIVGLIMGGLWFDLAVTATTARCAPLLNRTPAFFCVPYAPCADLCPRMSCTLSSAVPELGLGASPRCFSSSPELHAFACRLCCSA